MVTTVKFSQFTNAGLLISGETAVGLNSGVNSKFTTPLQFVANFTTVTHPSAPANPTIGYATDINAFQYWNGTSWLTVENTGDLAAFIAELASNTMGQGASLVGLQNQSNVSSKTVQDLANAAFIVQTNNGSLQNAQALGSLSTGVLKSANSTGIVSISAPLTSIDGLSTSANEMIYLTGSNVYATTALTVLARALLADTTTAAMQSTLGLGSAATHDSNFFLQVANNLSDVNSASTSRTNLGLGQAAVKSVTDNTKTAVASVSGVFTTGHVLLAADSFGTIKDGGSPAGMGTVTEVDTGAGLTGGPITTTGTISFAPIAADRILANITGGSAVPVENSLTDILDAMLGSSQGNIIYRSTLDWTVLTPGTNGFFLQTKGPAADPVWAVSPGSGTVSPGLINQLAWYAASGSTVSGLTTANNGTLVTSAGGVPSISSTLPNAVQDNITRLGTIASIGAPLGAAFGGTGVTSPTAHGVMIAEGASAMTPIVLGAGQILVGTTASDPAAAAINSGTGILVGNGSGSITVSLANVADKSILANISGGSAAPIANTLTAIIDSAIASTRGDIIYRNATIWTALAPGTAGFPLISGGAGADPSYGTAVVGGGGTGNTTFTAYSVICAGTTATGAFQNVSGVGSSGQVLTSQGAAALPIWANATGTGTVNSGTINDLAFYASSTNAVSPLATANNGLLVTSNTGVPSILAGPGATGKILQSNSAAAPSFSTATFPSTGGAAGNVLISDGTNYISSTSLWPNTVGSSGKLLQSNGTSNVYTTATYPTVATGTGTILRADGTNWVATTATFADTYAVSTILYASASNVVSGLATANSGVLVTSSGGVPSISSTLPAFTTSSITFSPTTGGIVGTTTNDNAAAGKVGEFISSSVVFGSAISLSNATAANVTSISLTAGDWDVWGNVFFNMSVSSSTIIAWISSTSATLPDPSLRNQENPVASTIVTAGIDAPYSRFSLSGTTTIYLSAYSAFGSGTATASGNIYARRAR